MASPLATITDNMHFGVGVQVTTATHTQVFSSTASTTATDDSAVNFVVRLQGDLLSKSGIGVHLNFDGARFDQTNGQARTGSELYHFTQAQLGLAARVPLTSKKVSSYVQGMLGVGASDYYNDKEILATLVGPCIQGEAGIASQGVGVALGFDGEVFGYGAIKEGIIPPKGAIAVYAVATINLEKNAAK